MPELNAILIGRQETSWRQEGFAGNHSWSNLVIDHNFVKQKSPLYSIILAAALLIAGGGFMSMTKIDASTSWTALGANASSINSAIPDTPLVRFSEILGTLSLSGSEKTQVSGMLQTMRQQNSVITDTDQQHANSETTHTAITAILSPAQRSDLQAKLRARPIKKVKAS